MPYPIPNWIQPVNPVPFFMQGVSQGESIAERQNRAELAIQEMTLRREAEQRQREEDNARRQVQAATIAQVGQNMAIQRQAAEIRGRNAAMQWQGQEMYQRALKAGKTPMEAYVEAAPFLNPEGVGAALARQEAIRQSAENAAERRGFEERRLKVYEDRNRLMVEPEVKVITDPLTGEKHSQVRGGPNTWRPLPAPKASTEDRELRAIEETRLNDDRRRLNTAMSKAASEGNTNMVDQLRAELLNNRTAMSNLVTSGKSQQAAPGEPWDKFAPSVVSPPPFAVPPELVSTVGQQNRELGIPVPGQTNAPSRTVLKEGATYRSKSTGKLYRIVNGEPIEQD